MRWERPNPNPHKSHFHDEVREQLRANPGEWAYIFTGARSLVTRWRAKYEGFEFTSRPAEGEPSPNRGAIYARWIGNEREE